MRNKVLDFLALLFVSCTTRSTSFPGWGRRQPLGTRLRHVDYRLPRTHFEKSVTVLELKWPREYLWDYLNEHNHQI